MRSDFSRARVALIINLEKLFGGNMRILLRCRQTLMAEQLLDGAQVRAGIEHVRGKRMPQSPCDERVVQ